MRSLRAVALRAILPAFCAAGFLAGCGDDKRTGPDGIFQYPVPSTPQNALEKLRLAYVLRDSVEYATVYDSSYVGESTDLNDPPGTQTLLFTFADEVAHVATLRRTPSVSAVVCDFGPQAAWDRLPSDDLSHPDWAVIQRSNVRIEIVDGPNLYQADGGNDVMTFKFKPFAPESSSPTDTLWRVVAWRETKNIGP